MNSKHPLTSDFFNHIVLKYPLSLLLCLTVVTGFLSYKAKDFKLDASAETLVLENDEDLKYSRLINSRYAQRSYLLLTYTPKEDLFSDSVLNELRSIIDELKHMKRVASVYSILDVPLLESPPVPVKEIASNIRTLQSDTVDKHLAKKEFSRSPLYNNLLVSPDLKTTALIINLKSDETYYTLLAQRNTLRTKQYEVKLSPEEKELLKTVSRMFHEYRDTIRKQRHQDILKIREIMEKHRPGAGLFLGGVDMIADDLIVFIKNDLKVFGIGVFCFLVMTLGIIFKRLKWIFMPMVCCLVSAVSMMGLLGLFGWEVTVVSSNFISLQLIITMAITIHLIVRYRELRQNQPDATQHDLVLQAVTLMLKPCLYAALTTIAGFGSLLSCDILPVKTFGWMMCAGITFSFVVTFLLFPLLMSLIDKGKPPKTLDPQFPLTAYLGKFTEKHGTKILVFSALLLVLSIIGISRLEVENSFIDYFKKSTEIHRGMKVIDKNLGGTTPLDVMIDFEVMELPESSVLSDGEAEDEFDEFDEFEDAEGEDKYWFTSDKMEMIKTIHNYLESLPETGKVLSLATMLKIAEKLNNNEPLDNFKLALLYGEIPEKFRTMLLTPYVSIENNQARFSIRVRDSEKTLKRNQLLAKIRKDLSELPGVESDQVHLSGMLVLYNNMLQALFSSQILTLGTVLAAILCMFLVLFRSLKIALIAMFPNLLSIAAVLGFMGWMGIPLDMMTITIASISVGIAVDNTIHYIHRFRYEFVTDRNYMNTLHRCHNSIGHAMYYTSLTIIMGFSILVLSNFIPTIYFGLLTGLAMLIALMAALTLLPKMIIVLKPFGPENR